MTVASFVDLVQTRRPTRPLLAFNLVDWASLQGVVDAAAEINEAVIAQFSASTVRFYGPEMIVDQVRRCAREKSQPVFVHLDHCRDDTLLEGALCAGFDGIMADGSHLGIEENRVWTRSWTERAHGHGVLIEGEMATISGEEDGLVGGSGRSPVSVDEFVAFARDTGVDLLGTDIGTAHGLYVSPPVIDLAFLEGLARSDCPAGVVIHGGSGLDAATLETLALLGAAKVNFSTDVKIAWWRGIQMAGTHPPGPLEGLKGVRDEVKRMARAKWLAFGQGAPV